MMTASTSTLTPDEMTNPNTRSAGTLWDPFRLMESMLNLAPYAPRYATGEVAPAYYPQFDVKETKDRYEFSADLPGVKEEDLDISLTGNQLVISGKRAAPEQKEQKEAERYHLSERSYGRFTRTFTLPDGISGEQVTAQLKDGVLTLSIGKRPEVQPRRIKLNEKQASA